MVSHWQDLTALAPPHYDHFPAGRTALSVALPIILLVVVGRSDLTIYASFAAFTSIYARHEPLRERLRHQGTAAALLLGAQVLGLTLAHSHLGSFTIILAGASVSALGAVLAAQLNLQPSGGLFLVFAVTALASLPHPAPLPEALTVAVLTAALCLMLGTAGAALSQRVRPGDLIPPAPHGLSRIELGWHAARNFIGPLLAGFLGEWSGFSHSYWAAVAACAVVSVVQHRTRVQRAALRVMGTMAGIGLSVFLLSFPLSTWALVALVVVLQFLAETFVARNYGMALVFITPLALLMGQIAHPVAPWELVSARAVETVLGVVCGLGVILTVRSPRDRRSKQAVVLLPDDED